jgi:hypothetical protein
MAKRYYNLEKETKAYLKACEDRGVVPSVNSSLFNDYALITKARNNNSEFLKTYPFGFNNLITWLDASINASYPQTGNTIFDLSINKNNGTLLNGPTFTSEFGGGISLMPRASRLISLNYNLGVDFTVQITAKNQNFGAWSTLFGNDVWSSTLGVLAYFETSTKIVFQASNSFSISFNGVDITRTNVYTFTHAANGAAVIYVNGVQIASGNFNFTPANNGTYIGSRHQNTGSNPNDPWGGIIYNTKIYNRSLTASEVLENFNIERAKFNL